jgi:hypothetical protein
MGYLGRLGAVAAGGDDLDRLGRRRFEQDGEPG